MTRRQTTGEPAKVYRTKVDEKAAVCRSHSLAHPRLGAAGVGSLRDVSRKIFEAARRTKSDNSFKRIYESSLANTKNAVHARLSTQRKILSCLLTMWIGNQPFRNDLIN
ncbi:MAG: hypothetical protein KIS76_12005 [Pyrinomonadaceae bacterium]|nr:hypothetical protein [Pyrinomonadaceae bacterium]